MANWCYNHVVFSGDTARVEKARTLFREVQEKQDRDDKIWLPPFVTAENGYMIDVDAADENIRYRSRWGPNIEALIQIADHFGVDFVNRYDEMAMGVFGEASYHGGVFSNISLDSNDFHACRYDPEKELYVFDGQTYEDAWPIFVKLLENKKASLPEFKTTSNISEKELIDLYGKLLPGDLLLKFAEHKNFDSAREVFRTMDERTIIEIDNFLIGTYQHSKKFATRDKFLAVGFLKKLLDEWNGQQRGRHQETGFGR